VAEALTRGLAVTAVDRTAARLEEGRRRAAAEGLRIEFVRDDARRFVPPGAFALALELRTSPGCAASPEDDLAGLRNLRASLAPGGVCVIDLVGKEQVARDDRPFSAARGPAPGRRTDRVSRARGAWRPPARTLHATPEEATMSPEPTIPSPRGLPARAAAAFLCLAALLAFACAPAAREPEPPPPAAGPPGGQQPAPPAGAAAVLESIDVPLTDTPVPGAATTVAHAFFPRQRAFEPALLARITLPPGFAIGVFASGLGHPRMLAVAENGDVYATRPATGDVVLLRDRDGDGRAEETRTALAGLPGVHGIAMGQGRLYLADVHRVYAAELAPDGRAGRPRAILDRLPDAGQHGNRTLGFGPDGMLYLSVGSLTNDWPSGDSLEATLLRVRPDGSGLHVHARGLRNTIGFGWHPETRELWGIDHGIDGLGDDAQPEELNRIVAGGDYGWPFCYGAREPNPTRPVPPGHASLEAYCATTVAMTLGYTAHSAPMQWAFYTGAQFPAEYRGDAFVALRGSWNRYPPSGYQVARVRFRRGRPVALERFASSWLLEGGRAHFGRPTGLAVARDGALLVGDDANGVIYRIRYTGGAR